MKPTMKLRILKTRSLYRGDPHMVNAYEGEYFVLQQWWAGEAEVKVMPLISAQTTLSLPMCIQTGEWRDVPVEAEE